MVNCIKSCDNMAGIKTKIIFFFQVIFVIFFFCVSINKDVPSDKSIAFMYLFYKSYCW